MLNKGDKAPAFSLPDQNGDMISLSQFAGKKVVLYFYPKDNTPGCTIEACAFRDAYDQILAKGAVVLGVSRDTKDSHINFHSKYNLPFYLLSDPEASAIRSYGALSEKKLFGKIHEGINRSTFIIDEKGMLAKVFPKVNPSGHAEEVLNSL